MGYTKNQPYAPPLVTLKKLPLWHTSLCGNENNDTYFSRRLLRQSVLYCEHKQTDRVPWLLEAAHSVCTTHIALPFTYTRG